MLRFDSPKLIDEVYDASLTPELWSSVLERLTKGYSACFGTLGSWSQQRGMFTVTPRFSCMPASLVAKLREVEVTEGNPFFGATSSLLCGEIVRLEEIISPISWRYSKAGEKVFRPTGVECGIGINLAPPGTGMSGLALFRDRTAGPFSDSELQLAERLAPHVVRAIRLMARLFEVEAREHLACEALDRLAFPVFIATSSGRVRYVNAAGRAITSARDGLCIVNCQLETLRIDETAELAGLIHGAALARKHSYSTSGGNLSVTRRCKKPSLNLLVTPLGPTRSGTDWPIEDAALIVASRPKPACARAAVMLQKQFNLTPAEIRLMQLVGEGIEPMQMAERLSVSITTIRTHLQRLFDKTGTRRQAELVRLVLTHPALIISGGDEDLANSSDKDKFPERR